MSTSSDRDALRLSLAKSESLQFELDRAYVVPWAAFGFCVMTMFACVGLSRISSMSWAEMKLPLIASILSLQLAAALLQYLYLRLALTDHRAAAAVLAISCLLLVAAIMIAVVLAFDRDMGVDGMPMTTAGMFTTILMALHLCLFLVTGPAVIHKALKSRQ